MICRILAQNHARLNKVIFILQTGKKGAVNLSLDAQAKDDNVSTTLNWGNNAAVTYSGQLAAVAKFLRTSGEKPLLKAMVVAQNHARLNKVIFILQTGKISFYTQAL